MFDTEQADWNALETLVDQELSGHWDDALSFLNLLREACRNCSKRAG